MAKIVGEVQRNSCSSFQWSIPDFLSLLQGYNKYQSPHFEYEDTVWCLEILSIFNNSFFIFLNNLKPDCLKHDVKFALGIKDKNGEAKLERERKHVFDGDGINYGGIVFSKSKILEERSNLVPENILTVCCTLKIYSVTRKAAKLRKTGESMKECTKGNENPKETGKKHEDKDSIRIPEGMIKMSDDLKSLFLKEHNCDVTLKVKDREFRAHKFILEARSPVFFSMFKHDTVEKRSGVVDIPDCDPDAFQDFILYVYSGRVEIMNSNKALSLYTVADKYGLDSLKTECIDCMGKELSVDTFGDIIALAVRHNESALIESTTSFFTKNAKKILATVKWQSFINENPSAANELHIKLLNAVLPD